MSRKLLDQLCDKRKRQKLRALLRDEEENREQQELFELQIRPDQREDEIVVEEEGHAMDIELEHAYYEHNPSLEVDDQPTERMSERGSDDSVSISDRQDTLSIGSDTPTNSDEESSPQGSSVDDGDRKKSGESVQEDYEGLENEGRDRSLSETETDESEESSDEHQEEAISGGEENIIDEENDDNGNPA